MKKLSYGLLLSLLFILNIGVVSAASCNKTTTIGEESETVIMTIYYTPSTTGYITEKETVYKFGMGYAFCRNAGLKASNTNFKCTREIASTTGTEAIDAGVMAIISEYRKGNYDYYTTMTALRMYDNYFSSINKNTSGLSNLSTDDSDYASGDQYKHHVAWNLAYAYLADQAVNSVKSELTRLKNAGIQVKSSVSSKYSTIQVTNVEFVSAYSYIASDSVELLKTGLFIAANVAEDGVDTAVTVEATELDVDTSSSNGTYKAVVSLKISYSGYSSLDEDDQILKLNYTDDFTTSSSSTVTMHLKSVDGVEYTNDTNVFEYTEAGISADEDGSFNLYIVYEFEDSSICTSGNDINYKLEFSYPASENNYDFSVYEMYGCDGDGCQYFYVIDDLGDSGNDSNSDDDELAKDDLEGSFSPCGSTCEVLEQECTDSGDENSTACQQYEQECGGECTTYVSNVTCSASEEELTIIEGVEGSVDSCEITQDLNVLQCVIGGSDLAGRSYETDYISDSNRFCSVYCAEEYHITLPGQQAVNAGRYFTLSASVEGYRRCYTSEIDSESTFTNLEKEARQKIYTAYNNWIEAKTIWEAYSSVSSDVNYKYYVLSDWVNTLNVVGGHASCDVTTYGNLTYYTKTVDVSFNILNSNGNFVPSSFTRTFGNYTFSYNYESHTLYGYQYDCQPSYDFDVYTPDEDYNDQGMPTQTTVDTYATALNQAISDYMELINEYNSCSGASVKMYNDTSTTTKNNLNNQTEGKGWEMDYVFSPTVTFWYQETYMNSARTDELDTDGNVSTGNMVQTYYTDDVDDSYEGNGTTSTSIRTNNYSKLTNTLCYSTTSGFACGSGITIYVSQAKYVKQEIHASGSYITPTQFYTIYANGTIVAEINESTTSADIANSEALENGLPVGLGQKGYYAYTLQVSGIGMYNDDDNKDPGRVWGDSGSVVETAATKYSVCYNDFAIETSYSSASLTNGVYVCYYAVSCQSGDCPDNTTGGNPDDNPPTCTPIKCPDLITNTIYRPVSTSNINPNDRVLGSNWNYAGTSSSTTTDINSITSVSTALQLKAYVTTLKIYNEGESVYDLDENNVNLGGEGNGGKYVLTVTVDSEMASWIKKYNKAAGDYVLGADVTDWTSTGESTLTCYDYYAVDGVLYENIFCYSSFLDDLFEKFPDNVAGTDSRPTIDQRTNSTSYVGTDTDSYWTTFDSYLSDSNGYWTKVITSYEVSNYTSYDQEIGIGPSWK